MELEAFPLGHRGRWGVRPKGALGTHGWIDGVAWQLRVFPNERAARQFVSSASTEGLKSQK